MFFGGDSVSVLNRIIDVIINPTLLLMFSIGFLVFLWGLIEFLWSGSTPQKHKDGTQHMLWGVIGMFIMVAFWGIIMIIADTFGFDVPITR